jgi:hypothetical protein
MRSSLSVSEIGLGERMVFSSLMSEIGLEEKMVFVGLTAMIWEEADMVSRIPLEPR